MSDSLATGARAAVEPKHAELVVCVNRTLLGHSRAVLHGGTLQPRTCEALLRTLGTGSRIIVRQRMQSVVTPGDPARTALARAAQRLLTEQQNLVQAPVYASTTATWLQRPLAEPTDRTDARWLAIHLDERHLWLPAPLLAWHAESLSQDETQGYAGSLFGADGSLVDPWRAWRSLPRPRDGAGDESIREGVRGAIRDGDGWLAAGVLREGVAALPPEGVDWVEVVRIATIVRGTPSDPTLRADERNAAVGSTGLVLVRARDRSALDAWFGARDVLLRSRTLDPRRIEALVRLADPVQGEPAQGIARDSTDTPEVAAARLLSLALFEHDRPIGRELASEGKPSRGVRMSCRDGGALLYAPRGLLNGNSVWAGRAGAGLTVNPTVTELLPALAAGERVVRVGRSESQRLLAYLAQEGPDAEDAIERVVLSAQSPLGLDPVRWAIRQLTSRPRVRGEVADARLSGEQYGIAHLAAGLVADLIARDGVKDPGGEMRAGIYSAALAVIARREMTGDLDAVLDELETLAGRGNLAASRALVAGSIYATGRSRPAGIYGTIMTGDGPDWSRALVSIEVNREAHSLPWLFLDWVVPVLLTMRIEEQEREDGLRAAEPLTIVLDEAWAYVESLYSGDLLQRMARSSRKYGGRLVVTGTSLERLTETKTGRAFLDNASTLWLGLTAHTAASIRALEVCGLDVERRRLVHDLSLHSGRVAEYVVRGGAGGEGTVVDLQMSPRLHWLLTTDPADLDVLPERTGTAGLAPEVLDSLMRRWPHGVRTGRELGD